MTTTVTVPAPEVLYRAEGKSTAATLRTFAARLAMNAAVVGDRNVREAVATLLDDVALALDAQDELIEHRDTYVTARRRAAHLRAAIRDTGDAASWPVDLDDLRAVLAAVDPEEGTAPGA